MLYQENLSLVSEKLSKFRSLKSVYVNGQKTKKWRGDHTVLPPCIFKYNFESSQNWFLDALKRLFNISNANMHRPSVLLVLSRIVFLDYRRKITRFRFSDCYIWLFCSLQNEYLLVIEANFWSKTENRNSAMITSGIHEEVRYHHYSLVLVFSTTCRGCIWKEK